MGSCLYLWHLVTVSFEHSKGIAIFSYNTEERFGERSAVPADPPTCSSGLLCQTTYSPRSAGCCWQEERPLPLHPGFPGVAGWIMRPKKYVQVLSLEPHLYHVSMSHVEHVLCWCHSYVPLYIIRFPFAIPTPFWSFEQTSLFLSFSFFSWPLEILTLFLW